VVISSAASRPFLPVSAPSGVPAPKWAMKSNRHVASPSLVGRVTPCAPRLPPALAKFPRRRLPDPLPSKTLIEFPAPTSEFGFSPSPSQSESVRPLSATNPPIQRQSRTKSQWVAPFKSKNHQFQTMNVSQPRTQPGGRKKIAQRFIAGFAPRRVKVPSGTKESPRTLIIIRLPPKTPNPRAQTPGPAQVRVSPSQSDL